MFEIVKLGREEIVHSVYINDTTTNKHDIFCPFTVDIKYAFISHRYPPLQLTADLR